MKKYLMMHKPRMVLNILWILVTIGLQTITSVLLTFSTNAVFSRNIQQLLFWVSVNLLVWLTMLASNYLQAVFQEKLVQAIMVDVRDTISKKIAGQSYADFHQKNVGQYISQYINDASNIEDKAFNNFFQLIADATAVVFSIAALMAYHFALPLVVILLAAAMLTLPGRLSRPMAQATSQLSQGNETLSNHLTNVLNGFDVLFNANKLGKLQALVHHSAQTYAHTRVDYTRTSERVGNSIGALSVFCQMIVDVVTSILAIAGLIPLGAISSTGNIAATVFNALSRLSNESVQIKATRPLFDKIAVQSTTADQTVTKTGFDHDISVKDVSYSIDGTPILSHLNCHFQKGGKYAIVGKSGAGKSTLLKILDGQITDYTGRVAIDGVDLRQLNHATMTGIAQYIDQNVYLFNDSVANNVSLWTKNMRPQHLQQALQAAAVDFVTTDQQMIDENGKNLSGGQKQRLALARFFYQPKPIVFLDEGTSALDAATATQVTERFLNDSEITLIEVSHRLTEQMRKQYDQVIML